MDLFKTMLRNALIVYMKMLVTDRQVEVTKYVKC